MYIWQVVKRFHDILRACNIFQFPRTSQPALPLETIQKLIAHEIQAVDALIRRRLDSDVVLVRTIAEYIIGSGGKRLRPVLVLLAAGAGGYRGSAHVELAAVVEFIHTATLLHDDVVDESSLRRGKLTANAEYGNAASVLVGDFLYSRAFQMMVGVGSMRIMEVLADATNAIAEGEVLQLINARNPDLDEPRYFDVIQRKTARLFEASARLGAIVSGAPASAEEGLARYGSYLGTAFQLIDDVLDYSGDETETGKHLGDDLAEGKMTLPLIHVLRHGSREQAAAVRRAIEDGDSTNFHAVLEAIQSTDALSAVRARAAGQAELASQAIESLPPSNHKQCLLELASFAVERRY